MRNLGMLCGACGMLLLGLAGESSLLAQGTGKEEMVPSPMYKHWSAFKVGTSVVRREKIKLPTDSDDGQIFPDSTLVKDTTYKLIELNDKKAVVEVTVQEHHRGFIQESAPVKMIYSANIKKGTGTPKESFAKHKEENVEVKIKGKTYKTTLIDTTMKTGDIVRTQQIWISDEVPGGIVKDHRVQKKGDQVLSESTLEVLKVTMP